MDDRTMSRWCSALLAVNVAAIALALLATMAFSHGTSSSLPHFEVTSPQIQDWPELHPGDVLA
jgi:hypothetical protein